MEPFLARWAIMPKAWNGGRRDGLAPAHGLRVHPVRAMLGTDRRDSIGATP